MDPAAVAATERSQSDDLSSHLQHLQCCAFVSGQDQRECTLALRSNHLRRRPTISAVSLIELTAKAREVI